MTFRAKRTAATLLGAATLLLAVPGQAHAENEITIDHIQSEADKVELVLSIDGIPGDAGVDLDSVAVDVNGRSVEADVATVKSGDIERTTILVLDASNSMRAGGKFQSATAAVEAFLDSAPEDVSIGLVTFADQVMQSIAPTTDHETIRAALADVTLASGTSVYDGILEGVNLAGTVGSRSLLVLSDGGDTGSNTTLDVASGTAEENGVVVDVVSLANPSQAAALSGLAEDTGGSVIASDSAALAGVFTARADALAQQLLISFDASEVDSTEASVDVGLSAGAETYRDSAFVTLGPRSEQPKVVESGKALVGKPIMLLGALALALGLAGVLATILNGATDTRSATERRLDTYFQAGKRGGQRAAAKTSGADLKNSAVAVADKVVSEDLESRIAQRLTGAGSALTAAEWVLIHAGVAVGSAAIGFIFGGVPLALLGLLLGSIVPWMYLKFRHRRRLNQFNAHLAQSLGLMAGGLQAGLSLPQAVDTVVREGNEPIAGEFRRALVEQRLGVDITEALESVGDRMESQDFGWVVMAIRIQREVGGNLAEILHTVSDTLREREYLRRQVKTLSAEGKLSAYILGGLPVGMFFYMMVGNREYASLLYTTSTGLMILGAAIFLLAFGGFMMSRLVKVEV